MTTESQRYNCFISDGLKLFCSYLFGLYDSKYKLLFLKMLRRTSSNKQKSYTLTAALL